MLDSSLVVEIRRMLAADLLSQREIGKLLGVSRGTVNAIASGKRVDRPERPKCRKTCDCLWKCRGVAERCPTCGSKVYMPCRLCALRAKLAKVGLKTVFGSDDSDWPIIIGLELRPAEQKRYEEVHAWKEYCEKHEITVEFRPGIMDDVNGL